MFAFFNCTHVIYLMYTHTHTHIHTHAHTHTHTSTHKHTQAHTSAHTSTHKHAQAHTSTHTRTCIHIRTASHTDHTHTHIRMHTHKHTQAHASTHTRKCIHIHMSSADALVKASGPWQLGDDIHDVRHVFLPHAAQSQSAAQHQSPCTGQHASQMTVAGQDLGHHESKQASLDVDCSSRGACHSSGPLHAEERRSGVGGGGGGNGGGEGGGFGGAKDGTSWELRSHLLAMHGGALTSPGPPAHGFICDPLYTPGSPWADPFVDPCAGD